MSSNNDTESNTKHQSRMGHGLVSQRGVPVPLKSIDVDIKIIGFVAEVTSSLQYTNSEKKPIEAEFTFPVDDGSAVFKFEAEVEGRRIVAEIQEKEQAKLTYQDAVEKGSTAMLLKEDNTAGDIFQCTLGNLPPKTDAKISFSYVIELPQEPDGKIRFILPTVLNPRYSPDVGGVLAAEGATYTAPTSIPYQFSMTGSVRGYHSVLSVTSQQDKLQVEKQGDKLSKISLAEDFKFDHDLSFLVEYNNCYSPQVVLEMGNSSADNIMKENMLMVNFFPKLEDSPTSTPTGEYIFVIDRSGSMRGDRIKNAKEALFLFLKSLPAGCYFNVVSFGSSYSSLFKMGSSEYNKSNLKDALNLQGKMNADMGGTEILEPLKHVLGKKVIKGHPRQLILLTDGEVGNTDRVIALIKSNAHNTRVFTLGIGSGVSTSLIKGVARAGNGKAEFITDKDRIQPKVVSLLKCATQPSMSNIELKWNLPEGVTAVPIPSQPPTFIGLGERLCLYTLLNGGLKSSAKSCSVSLSGQCEGKPVDFKMEFTVPTQSEINESAPLHRLAAKTQIKILETEESEIANADEFYYQPDSAKLTEIRQKVILVSKSANLVSKMTAFVAVDKEGQKQGKGKMVKRSCPVPVATKEFREGLNQRDPPDATAISAAPSASLYCNYEMNVCYESYKSGPFDDCVMFADETMVDSGQEEERGSPKLHKGNKMSEWFEMVSLQEIDGYWELTQEVTSLLKIQKYALKSLDVVKDMNMATTLAVIVWLRSMFSSSHEEWEMIEKKALIWLSTKIQKDQNLEQLIDDVKKKLWPGGII